MRSSLIFAGVALLVLAVAVLLLEGCKPASSPQRETARAAVTVAAEAVHALDVECARIVRARADRALGEKCDAFYRNARAVLVGSAHAVDAWAADDARRDVTCVVVNVARELAVLAREIAGKGGKPLAVVDDALSLAGTLGECHPVEADVLASSSDAGGDR